jgi:hypothetical protein
MTQPSNQPPITNPAGRELVERDTFRNEAIWLPAMAAQHLNAEKFMIDGKTFTDCLIEGPAVLAIGEGVQFEGCNMGAASDIRTLLLTPRGPKVAGAVGFSNTRFVNCRFMQIGFTGSEAAVAELEQGLLSTREAMDKLQKQAEQKASQKAGDEGKAS